jgi:hypothetical protein
MSKKDIAHLEAFNSYPACQSKDPLRDGLFDYRFKKLNASQAFLHFYHL